jgi:DNA-directed RNA polymerase specialized sigma24 family protein
MSSRVRTDWQLNAETLARLMGRLGRDVAEAGEQYEHLRRTLVRFFDWRGVNDASECADIALDRLARKIDENVEIANIQAFAYGIARHVLLEQSRQPGMRPAALHDLRAVDVPEDTRDPLRDCFDACLQQLAPDARSVLLRYYAADRRARIDARIALAQDLRLSQNALRSRAQRLRDRLERCTLQCTRQRTFPEASR